MIQTRLSRWLIISLVFLILSIVVVAWASQADSEKPLSPQWMAAEFSVSGMTCGGCVYTIGQSLKPVKGVQSFDVDLHGQKVLTIYDASQIGDPQLIARAISDSGYPATFTRQVPLKMASTPDTGANEKKRSNNGSTGTRGGGCPCCSGYNYKTQ